MTVKYTPPILNYRSRIDCICLGFSLPMQFVKKTRKSITLVCAACLRELVINRRTISKDLTKGYSKEDSQTNG